MMGDSLHKLKDALTRLRAVVSSDTRRLTPDEMHAIGMGEAPRDPLHGSDEAKLRAVAADLVRRRGGEVASKLGDVFVAAIQEERRK